jgi:hypothetical protein
MKIPVLWLKVCLFAFVAISVVLTFQLTVAAQQICSSGVCVTTWQQDTCAPISAATRTDSEARYSRINE